MFATHCDEYGIDNIVDFGSAECSKIVLLKVALQPLHMSLFDALHEAVVDCRAGRRQDHGLCANLK